jgi:hypothetical protein
MNNKEEILKQIDNINEQIILRISIPDNLRTEKQRIKLDNLLHELKQLNDLVKNQ